MNNDAIENALTDEWKEWCESQGLQCISADEMEHDDLSVEQRRYVSDFIMRWEEVC